MIAHTIYNAKNSNIFKNIYVTTDSLKIKKISEFYGAKVPKLRSKKLSRDKVGIQDVLINFIKLNDLTKEKYFFFIYATAILVTKRMIRDAFKKFKKQNCDFLIGVQEFQSNPLRALTIKNDSIKFVENIYSKKNTNKIKKFYHDAGSFFVFKTKKILENPKFLPKRTSYFLHKKYEVCDIDDKEDLKLAKILLKNK